MHRENESEWDSSVIQEIVGFYVDSIVASADVNNSDGDRLKKKQTRLQTCFRMVRDLALFQNDFYIDEMCKIYDTNFKGEFIDLSRYVSDAEKREEQARLVLFLEQVIENHPAYRKYVDLTLRRNLRSPLPLCALSWLAQCHLRPNISLQKRARTRPRKSNEYWIWEKIPKDMDVALEKLLPVVTKYMRVLGQFFLRQAVQGSSTTGKPQDYRMSSTAFINLMKQVRVFPQLSHRRELEIAVKQSSCSSPESEELNFPEFIEALVRCSCNLRWGELDGSNPAANTNDTVVVIKFVMLIFAMEGQGTVLKKRNEDVGAILGFLGEQQKKKQAEKMFRFRKMLSDNRRRERASRKYQVPSVWNQVRLHFSPRNSPTRFSTKSHDTFDELTESWDGGSPRCISTEPFVFDAQTDQPFGLELSPTPSAESRNDKHDEQVHLNPAEFATEVRTLNSDNVDKGVSNPPSPSGEVPSTYAGQAIGSSSDAESSAKTSSTQLELTPAIPAEDDQKANSSFTNPISSTNSARDTTEIVSRDEGGRTITQMQPSGLVEPMEKDEFLREILNSIGDVELMLNQPRFAGSNYSKNGKHHLQRVPTNTAISTQRGAEVDSNPGNSADMMDSEVQIRDPMLNYLTDVQRFTESTDRNSLLATAHLSGLPFEELPAQTTNDFSPDSWTPQGPEPAEEVRTSTTSQPPADLS
ncbi:hypothetical protein PF002_g14397 [Phytophthora fragariae]|uniref:Uncharacterized protein n=1 Tax=Phytophthora fragariae TaxID=53985 RepID=A0A6A3YUU6_9STRA|nr:hypothetical protein PF003_g35621 [Phytophthora fragariae]KAE9225452.1 hypothetical protein PF002_g14397 [Phytophthora fragariae]